MRPPCFPRAASRSVRSPVEAGSIEYSAVSQPRPLPYIQRGTDSCTDAVQSTIVFPARMQRVPGRVLDEVDVERGRAQVVGPPAVGPGHAASLSSSATVTSSTSAIGSWRKRAPIARKVSRSPVVRNR